MSEGTCRCGRPLVYRPTDLEPSCFECGYQPDSCPCHPLAERDTHLEGHGDLLANMHNGKWLDQQNFPPLTQHVPGIVIEGLTVLAAAPKVGKSCLILDCGLAVAHDDGYALGCLPTRAARPVFYLALEDGNRRLQERCRRMLGDQPIPERLDYLTTVMPDDIIATLDAWLAQHGAEKPLLILDTLGRVMPPAQSGDTYRRDYQLGAALKQLADDHPGTALVVVHHDRKASGDDFVANVSGTNGIAGSADNVLVLTRPRGQRDGLLRVTGRDIAEGEYALTFDAARWTLDGVDLTEAASCARKRKATANLSDRSIDVYDHVHRHPEGVSPAEVALALQLDRTAAQVYLSRLAEKGRITHRRRGVYAPLTANTTNANNAPTEPDDPG